jgi:surface protein
VDWTDSDGSMYSTPYGNSIIATPCNNPLVSISVDDDDVVVGSTMSITATTSNFTATSYLFYVNDGNQLTFLAEQASNVYNWTTNVIGSLELYVVATDGVSEVADMINVTVNSNPAFITEWVTWYVKDGVNYSVSAANQIKLPLISTGNYNFVVDWGDGNTDTITTWNQAETLHTYASEGQYTVTITGTIEGWMFGSGDPQAFGSSDRSKIINIINWGTLTITNIAAFYGCIRLDSSAIDAPIINTTSLENTFRACRSFDGYVGNWDVSGVQKFGFGGQGHGMFRDCIVFNNGGVNDMDNWDTSSLNDIQTMFLNCAAFNQDLPSWDVSSCTSLASVFSGCIAFNGDVTTWDVSNITNFVAVFNLCAAFNQDISGWNVSNGQNFYAFMQNCRSFNQDLSGWVLSSATDCRLMFRPTAANSSSINFDVSGWDMGSATILGGGGARGMFALCQYFDQSFAGWKIENITSAQFFLEGVGISTSNYDSTLVAFEARLQSLYPGGVGYPNSPFWEFGTSKYTIGSAADTARTSLVSTFGWTIADGGGI